MTNQTLNLKSLIGRVFLKAQNFFFQNRKRWFLATIAEATTLLGSVRAGMVTREQIAMATIMPGQKKNLNMPNRQQKESSCANRWIFNSQQTPKA